MGNEKELRKKLEYLLAISSAEEQKLEYLLAIPSAEEQKAKEKARENPEHYTTPEQAENNIRSQLCEQENRIKSYEGEIDE